MATAADSQIRVGGIIYSRASTRTFIAGVLFEGIRTWDWAESNEGEYARGQNPSQIPLGITAGQYQIDSWSMELYVDSAEQVLQTIGAIPSANGSFGRARFDVLVQLQEPGGVTLSHHMFGAKIEKRSSGVTDDAAATVVKIEGKALYMVTQGEGRTLSGVAANMPNVFGT